MDEVLDFSMKKAKFSPTALDDSHNRATPEWRKVKEEFRAVPDSQRSDSSTGSNVSPNPSSNVSPTSYQPASMTSLMSALMSANSGLSGFPGFPGSPAMMSDSAFFPSASLALSALHRRRRNSSINDNQSDVGGKKVKSVPDEKKDDAYWERRRKNNDAAKRSRDSRRAKEEEIAIRAAMLEQENLKLKAQVAILKNESAKLHYMLFSHCGTQ